MRALLSSDAQAELDALPVVIRARYRIRTGDWRIIFRLLKPNVIVVRIKHRSEVYEG